MNLLLYYRSDLSKAYQLASQMPWLFLSELRKVHEASRILSISYNTVLRLAQAGELKAFRIRNSWRTSTTACESYINEQFRIQAAECQPEKKEG